jgi:hypothetical protein
MNYQGYGDACEFPESFDAAHEWVKKALLHERFNYFVIWEKSAGYWYFQDEYKRSDPVRSRLSRLPSNSFGKSKTSKGELRNKATKNTGQRYSQQEVRELRSYAKARTPLKKIAKALKRSEVGILQKAAKLKIRLQT